ncbi:MAG TPA: hypothetical protein VKB58_01135 [Terriglobales bacterium]|jgi:hypothetical protein|nr:hypothetical protein [Terriglobales bacterium]
MARTDKPTDTASGEWAKHLRPEGKKRFHGIVRRKVKEELRGKKDSNEPER